MKAKKLRLGCGPRAATIAARAVSASKSSASVDASAALAPSACLSAVAASPVCELCASSTMIANRCDARSTSSSLAITNGNVSRVTVTICALPASALASSADFESFLPSILMIVPGTDSNWDTVARSASSSDRRSVTTMILSNTLTSSAPCSSESRCASQPIEFDLPEPAECCTR